MVQYDYKNNRFKTIAFVKKYLLLSKTLFSSKGWIVSHISRPEKISEVLQKNQRPIMKSNTGREYLSRF